MIVQRQRSTKQFWTITVAILLLASAVRIYRLAYDSVWLDEINTLNVVRVGSVFNPLSFATRDHPPLLYWLTALFTEFYGETEFALRLAAVFAGIASVALLIAFGRIVESDCVGWWAGLLLALLPFHIHFSQEARHYTMLMFLSLATYLFLYRALSTPRWRWWLAFAVCTLLNLYTHYGAFLVLVAESILILIWCLVAIRHGAWRRLLFVAGSASLVIVLYFPQMVDALQALTANTDLDAEGVTASADLVQWASNAFYDFGYNQFLVAITVLALAAYGIERWLERKRSRAAGLALLLILIPLFLIALLEISRWSFSKYIIYMLPIYLLLAAVGIEDLRLTFARLPQKPRRIVAAVSSVGIIILLLLALPKMSAEYETMDRDWRGAVNSISQQAQDGDVFVSLAMDLPDGFNQGGLVLPYYFDQQFDDYTLLASSDLRSEVVVSLADSDAAVWGLAFNRIVPLASTVLDSAEFQGDLFTLTVPANDGSALEKLIILYENAIPLAVAPAPQCLFQQDLAVLHLANADPVAAATALDDAIALCSDRSPVRDELAGQVYAAVLADAQAAGDALLTRQAAVQLLALDAKNADALAALTVVDLVAQFEAGESVVSAESSPEPVEVRRFTMPQDGDFEDVIFAHPTTGIRIAVALPTELTFFAARLALDPASWEWGGDGVTFVVSAETDSGTTELLRQHITKGEADRRWHNISIPLGDFVGQEIVLVMMTEPGSSGDDSADWAGWGAPRIMLGVQE